MPASGTRVAFVLEYNFLAYTIQHIIKEHWHLFILKVASTPPRMGLKHSKNIRDMVVHTDQTDCQRRGERLGHVKCGCCLVCLYPLEITQFETHGQKKREVKKFNHLRKQNHCLLPSMALFKVLHQEYCENSMHPHNRTQIENT